MMKKIISQESTQMFDFVGRIQHLQAECPYAYSKAGIPYNAYNEGSISLASFT